MANPVTITDKTSTNAAAVNGSGQLSVTGTFTPSGTQDVNLKQINGVTVLAGAGATGTGSQRATVAQDTTTIAGSAPGTAGTPSTNVVTVQGATSMTPLVIATTGAYITVTPTIQNAQYISGNNMGGLQTIALGTSQSVLNQVTIASQGGLATGKVIYIFAANPSGSTFTDKGTFTIATADLSKLISVFTLTPTAPTGTTKTFAAQSNMGLGIPSGGTIYLAIVETATETPSTTTDLVLTLSAF